MVREFPKSHWKPTSLMALIGAIALASTLFLIIPLTQLLGDLNSNIITYREILTIKPPPPLVPPSIQPEELPKEDLPKLEPEIEELTLNQLELSLNPGIGDALAMGIRMQKFETELDAIEAIRKVFTFADLPQPPHIINTPRITFPRELIQRGIKEGKVVLLIEIDERGKAKVLSVLSSTHSRLEPVAKGIAKRALFTIPEVDGTPVKVQGEWPLYLQAP